MDGSGTAVELAPSVMSESPMPSAGPVKVTDFAEPEKFSPADDQLQYVGKPLQEPLFADRAMVARTVPVPLAPLQTVTVR